MREALLTLIINRIFGNLVGCLRYGDFCSLTFYLQVEVTALVALSQAHLLRALTSQDAGYYHHITVK